MWWKYNNGNKEKCQVLYLLVGNCILCLYCHMGKVSVGRRKEGRMYVSSLPACALHTRLNCGSMDQRTHWHLYWNLWPSIWRWIQNPGPALISFLNIPTSEGAHMFPGFQRHGHLYFLSSIFSGFIFLPVSEPHFPTSHLLVLSSCVSQLSSECSGTFVFMFSIFLTCLLSCRERIKTNERRLYSPKVFCKTPAVGSGFFFIEKSVFYSLSLDVCLSVTPI